MDWTDESGVRVRETRDSRDSKDSREWGPGKASQSTTVAFNSLRPFIPTREDMWSAHHTTPWLEGNDSIGYCLAFADAAKVNIAYHCSQFKFYEAEPVATVIADRQG